MESLTNALNYYLASGSLIALGIAFLAGVLTSFTPCVYPLFPVVASYTGSRSEKTAAYSFFLSVFYVLGIALVYAFLGVLASFGGKIFGNVQTNPWVNLAIGNLFILFGLSLLDVFHFPLLGSLSGPSAGKSKSIFGAFLLGITSGFIAAPCTTAVLASLLTYVATQQSWMFGGALLFTYALGMGVLLILIGTFSGIVSSLPKAGAWMVGVQKFFGIIVILVGEYFLIKAGEMGLFQMFY
jgi:thiol:disulfide interchange protein DsbD